MYEGEKEKERFLLIIYIRRVYYANKNVTDLALPSAVGALGVTYICPDRRFSE